MNRNHVLRRTLFASIAAVAALLAGCASSTKPGAVGIERTQLLMVPTSQINAQAAQGYTTLSSTARSKGALNTDAQATARVRGISERLIKQVGVFKEEAVAWKWEVNVFKSDDVNAFCYPGGKIGVYTGLIYKLDLTDDELAAVIGHEIAHALREHGREKASQQSLVSATAQGVAAGAGKNGALAGAVTGVGAQLFIQLPNSRGMETEADIMGLELMARAGYDPRAASNVWRKMQKLSGGGTKSDFFSTHPNGDDRIVALDAVVPKVLHLYQAAPVSARAPAAEPKTTPVAPASNLPAAKL